MDGLRAAGTDIVAPVGSRVGEPVRRSHDGRAGYLSGMTNRPDEAHIKSRAELLPEEVAAGSDDPQEQAEVILEESQDRTDDPEGTGAESAQTSTPDDRPF